VKVKVSERTVGLTYSLAENRKVKQKMQRGEPAHSCLTDPAEGKNGSDKGLQKKTKLRKKNAKKGLSGIWVQHFTLYVLPTSSSKGKCLIAQDYVARQTKKNQQQI